MDSPSLAGKTICTTLVFATRLEVICALPYVSIIAVDFPQANRLTVHILAAVAEHEASMISARTKAALASVKSRGVELGSQRGSPDRMGSMAKKGSAASASVRRAAVAKRNDDLYPVIEDIRAAGLTTRQLMASMREASQHLVEAPGRPYRCVVSSFHSQCQLIGSPIGKQKISRHKPTYRY